MTIIVGGNARNVGKTTLVCQLIRASRQREWTAVKISGHPHGAQPPPAPAGVKPRATAEFLAAGAAHTYLLHENEPDRALLAELARSGRPLIVESNRAAQWIPFDLYVFILDEHAPHPKPHERWLLDRASWVLPPRADAPASLLAVTATQL